MVTGGIAVVTGIEAWGRLQFPEGAQTPLMSVTSGALVGVALPLLAIAVVMALTWLVRRVRVKSRPASLPNASPLHPIDPSRRKPGAGGRAAEHPHYRAREKSFG
jgi:hypothetical protein